jgi:hypothetical protein
MKNRREQSGQLSDRVQAALSASSNARPKFKVQADPEQASNFHWIFTGLAV